MKGISSYKKLIAWQRAMDLMEEVYRITVSLPKEEKYGLISQIRRAAVSIPSNIAEGFGRTGRDDFLRFLDMALGSTNEVETQILIMIRLKMRTQNDTNKAIGLIQEIQRILKGLIRGVFNTKKNGVRNSITT